MPETILTGLRFPESPRWHDGRLWLCNWLAGEVVAVDPADGAAEVAVRIPTSIPFSIDWLPDGRLIVVSGPERTLLVAAPDGSLAKYADLTGVVAKGAVNELVVGAAGNAYVNGGGFDLMAGEPFAPGVVVLVTPDGAGREVADGIHFGNGMAITADKTTLLVAESYAARLSAFAIEADGSLGERRVWADLGEGAAPDGICVDADGAAWYADVPNRRCVRVREGGEVLDVVDVDRGCFACMLGGEGGRTLFIAAAEWRGGEAMATQEATGVLLAAEAPAPHAGYP